MKLLSWLLVYASMSPVLGETLTVSSKRAVKGSASNQNLSVLTVNDQSGSQNNWNSYVELKAGSASNFVVEFQFDFSGSPSSLTSLEFKMNSMGESSNKQVRKVLVRKGLQWVKIMDNQSAASWTWYMQSKTLTSQLSNYFKNGKLKLRVVSNNNADALDIDYLVIEATTQDGSPVVAPVATPVAAPVASPVASPTPGGQLWQPKASDKLTWQWQLQGNVDTANPLPVDVYDIDLFDNSAAKIAQLKSKNIRVICYFSAGTYEGWRDDWKQFFPFITGDSYTGNKKPFAGNMAEWDERWLDIREIDLLRPIMSSRIQLAVDKGCDAVEPDNMDAYTNGGETGINLSAADQLAYNKFIADLAHSKGIAVGLKNDVNQLGKLVDSYDFAINEQCFQYKECDGYSAFTNQDKAVFGVEYKGDPAVFCPKAQNQKLSWLKKKLSLLEYRIGCEDY